MKPFLIRDSKAGDILMIATRYTHGALMVRRVLVQQSDRSVRPDQAGCMIGNLFLAGAGPNQPRAASRCARSRLSCGSISAISASDSTPPMAAI